MLTYNYNQLGQITQVVRTQGSTQAQWHYTLEYIGDDIFAIFARDDQQPQP